MTAAGKPVWALVRCIECGMQELDMKALASQVLWAAFGLSVVFGAIAQRTHFCTMGAVADIVNMGDWSRMRMWLLAMAVAILGFNAMVGLGWVEARHSVYAAPRLIWLSNALGDGAKGHGQRKGGPQHLGHEPGEIGFLHAAIVLCGSYR